MHTYTLHAHLPSPRHNQVLAILAGLTATPTPPHILERHYIYRPMRNSGQNGGQGAALPAGASQNVDERKVRKPGAGVGEARYVRVVEDMGGEGVGDVEVGEDMEGVEGANGTVGLDGVGAEDEEQEGTWTLHDDEVPEAGVRSHISRKSTVREMQSRGEVESWALAEEMALVTSFLVVGHWFVYGNVLVRLFRVMRLIPHDGMAKVGLGTPLRDFERRPLDESGAWVLEAGVRMEDAGDTAVTNRAQEEMRRLREDLEGAVELRVVDRLSLDTRAR